MSQYPTSNDNHDDENGPEEFGRLDQSLRDKFSDFRLPPKPELWAGIEQRLPPDVPPQRPGHGLFVLPWKLRSRARRRSVLLLALLFPFFLLLAAAGGWLLRGGSHELVTVGKVVPEGSASTSRPAATRAAVPGAATQPASQDLTAGTRESHAVARQETPAVAFAQRTKRAAENGLRRASGQPPKPLLRSAKLAAPTNPMPQGQGGLYTAIDKEKAANKKAEAASVLVVQGGGGAMPATAEEVPTALRALMSLERQAGISNTTSPRPMLGGGPSRETIVAALRAEKAELSRLQHRADSLLLALGETPAPLVAAQPAADTAKARLPLTHRWSLLLSATPEQNTFGLKVPASDTINTLRRNHETGRVGLSASLLAEYKLNDRMSIGVGIGYNRSGAELRLTNRRTDIGVTFDTTTTRTTSFYTSTNTVYAIRLEQIPQLSPRFNGSGQVIGYDTVFVSRQDTVFTTIVQRDSINKISQTINPRITKKETVTYKDLRPDYHFFTLPIVFRYHLTPTQGRWWADVAGGMQLQFFLGGTQLVSEDGRNFRTETVGPRGGPFRPLSIGLSGSLALNYALNSRMSFSLAPGIRWQVLSVYKPESGLSQNPIATGIQLGVRWKL